MGKVNFYKNDKSEQRYQKLFTEVPKCQNANINTLLTLPPRTQRCWYSSKNIIFCIHWQNKFLHFKPNLITVNCCVFTTTLSLLPLNCKILKVVFDSSVMIVSLLFVTSMLPNCVLDPTAVGQYWAHFSSSVEEPKS